MITEASVAASVASLPSGRPRYEYVVNNQSIKQTINIHIYIYIERDMYA